MHYLLKSLLTSLFFLPTFAQAAGGQLLNKTSNTSSQEQTVFEGYYKILAGKKHIGFVINRFRVNTKAKTIRSTYYIRTNAIGGNITESLDAYADDKFHPLSYQFTQTSGKKALIIDASFQRLNKKSPKANSAAKIKSKKNSSIMNATISDGVTSKKVNKTISGNDFLSTFLAHLMLSNGISTDKRYGYTAIAEEDASLHKGDAYVEKNTEKFLGHNVFKIRNVFKKSKFISYVTITGEVLKTYSPAQGISTELVANPELATNSITFNINHLTKLFGSIPLGKKNVLALEKKKSSQ